MGKQICKLLLGMLCTVSLLGCAGTEKQQTQAESEGADAQAGTEKQRTQADTEDTKTVQLTVWGAKEDEKLMGQVIQGFLEYYKGKADFQISFAAQGESQCKDVLLGGLEEGADVFAFADDQLNALAAAGAVEPIGQSDDIKSRNLPATVDAATINGQLYAYPLTADNGYFLYYNKRYISPEQAKTLDGILNAAAANGRVFAMDWSSAWYVYAFFGNTGMEIGVNDDGITNFCTWNQADGDIRGIDVAQAMLRISANPGFSSRTDEAFLEGVKDGSVVAGVSGVWNAVAIQQAWGEDAGASRLPTYTCGGSQVQMASFSGCKLIGVNAYSSHPKWAARLAEWITNEQNQKLRFEMRGQGPSNKKVAESAQVRQSTAIAALLSQSEFSQLQRIGGKFWDPVSEFAQNMAAGNPSGKDLQEQLDAMAQEVCAR